MANQKPAYDQKSILAETEALIKKTIDAQMKKYPGVQLPWQISVIVPSAPLTVEHSTNTRPLNAKDATVPALTPKSDVQ